jgi:CRISPR-associated protein Csd2
MACRGLHVFSHTSPLGDAKAHELLERVRVQRREDVAVPRAFTDYVVTVDTAVLPDKVTYQSL